MERAIWRTKCQPTRIPTKSLGLRLAQCEALPDCAVALSGAKFVGVQGVLANALSETGTGGVGGVAHGTLLKSKKSSRFGCAASRAVK